MVYFLWIIASICFLNSYSFVPKLKFSSVVTFQKNFRNRQHLVILHGKKIGGIYYEGPINLEDDDDDDDDGDDNNYFDEDGDYEVEGDIIYGEKIDPKKKNE
jgi:hypothetical protein